MVDFTGVLGYLIDGVHGNGVMGLEFLALPGMGERLVVREYYQPPPIYLIDKMTKGMLYGQKLPDVGSIPLLLGLQGLAPEPEWPPGPIHILVQTSSQAHLGGIRREGQRGRWDGVIEDDCFGQQSF